jgi:hypothetical protein
MPTLTTASPSKAHSAPASDRPAQGFSRGDACRIVGVSISTLLDWERFAAPRTGAANEPPFTLSDLLAFAVTREMVGQLGPALGDFTFGLGQLFDLLAAQPGVDRLDDHSAVVGRDFARLCKVRDKHVSCHTRDFVVVPFRPVLSDFRDPVFP